MPIYDGDAEEASGLPAGASELVRRVHASDAVVISTPEYNGGIPGALKNAIDWASRAEEYPFDSKPILLLSASPGAFGGVRGLWHTRVPLEAMGSRVYPEMFGLPKAHQAFAQDGAFTDPKNVARLQELLESFADFAKRLTPREPATPGA